MPLTPNEQLDAVLKCLSEASDSFDEETIFLLCNDLDSSNSISTASKTNFNVPRETVSEILRKLEKDEFLDAHKFSGLNSLSTYKINFEGRVFSQDGGYTGRFNRQTSAERISQSYERTLARGTFWIALGTLGLLAFELLKFWMDQFCHCHH